MSICTSFGPSPTGYYKQLVGKLDLHNCLATTESFTQFPKQQKELKSGSGEEGWYRGYGQGDG